MISVEVKPYTLNFAQPAGTSRGVYKTRKSWFVVVKEGAKVGVGECAPLPNLSCDDVEDYEKVLLHYCNDLAINGMLNYEELRKYPSMLFGLEVALLDLNANEHVFWDTSFSRGEEGLPINGLIWMGSHDFMLKQIDSKVENGFRCLKLKVGAIDFDQELDLVRHIRNRYAASDLEIRLDANGGFSFENALDRLNRFSKYAIHSIEQPIKAGCWENMAALVRTTPIPIALDEELIGINSVDEKNRLINVINPHYIILKPSLHGGIMGSTEWLEVAQKNGIGWWITSALESNVGLNAIAQWCASLGVTLPQGLGTGMLFTNNFESPLYIKGERLCYSKETKWNLKPLF